METALHLCDWSDITLHAPYLHLTKADIVKIGTRLGVDYSLTWTCYRGEALACQQRTRWSIGVGLDGASSWRKGWRGEGTCEGRHLRVRR